MTNRTARSHRTGASGPRPSLAGRALRLLAAVALTAAFSGGAVVAEPDPSPLLAIDHSRGTPGYCPDSDGVTVVIDFQELGGDTIIRCAPGDQETGHAALINAGIEITGTNRWGEAFICRIEGKPSPESEPCIDTPPASAYWSYWHAPNEGAWTYSQWGVMNRKPPLGSFEGWSFSLNRSADTNPPPRVAPVRPASGGGNGGSDSSGGSGNPEEAGRPDGSGSSGGSGAAGGSTTPGANGTSGNGSAHGGAGTVGDGPDTTVEGDEGTGADAGEPGSDSAAPEAEPSRFDEPAPGPDDLPSEVPGWEGEDGGAELVANTSGADELPWGTFLGGAAAVLLAVVGLSTAWQRRRERGAHAA